MAESELDAEAGIEQPAPTRDPPKASALTVLRVSAFRSVLGDSAFGSLGFQTLAIAQAWVVLELTDSDAWVGIVNGLPAIPAVILALFGGVLADRLNRRVLLIWMRVLMSSLGFLAGALIYADLIQVWHFLLIATAFTIARSFSLIANSTLVVDILGRDRLFIGNAVYGTTFNIANFAGPAIGGILIARAGADTAFFAAGGMIAMAVGFAFQIKVPERQSGERTTSVMDDLRAGMSYIWDTPALRWLAFIGLSSVFVGMYFPVVPGIARDSLGTGADGYGSILASLGVGSLVGSIGLLLSGSVRSVGRLLVIVSLFFSVMLIAFAFVNSLMAAWVVSFSMGVAIPWWTNLVRTALQLPTSEEMRGRVMAMFAIASQTLLLGWVVGGVTSEFIGPKATLISAGVSMALFYVFVWMKSSAIRQLGRE